MAATAGINNFEPTQDDRTMATLAHALGILGFIAPLVIFLVKRQSRFVSFHALQSLLWHIAYIAIAMVFMVLWFVVIFATVAHTAVDKSAQPPVGIFFLIPLLWVFIMAAWVVTLVLVIVFAIKASQGEWADIPVFGKIARKILKMGPVGPGVV
jgi:uncharacterized membrane protein